MKRFFATAAVCAALTGLLTGCSGTNEMDGYRYDNRNGMVQDGYYDGRNGTIYGVEENKQRNDRANRNARDYSDNESDPGKTMPRTNNSTTR